MRFVSCGSEHVPDAPEEGAEDAAGAADHHRREQLIEWPKCSVSGEVYWMTTM